MFPRPTYSQIKARVLNEYVNQAGFVPPPDSDAAIRADGTAAVAEGIHQHIDYVKDQLFVATADEPYLYLHADRLGIERMGGSVASGQVRVVGNTSGISLPAGSTLTDGFGHYFDTTTGAILTAGSDVLVPVIAQRKGASYNLTGTLSLVSPPSGVQAVVQIETISGGSDGESLERFRARILSRQQLGKSLSRAEDLRQAVLGVSGVSDCYIYPLRRGAGSVDAAVTAQGGDGATLPSDALLNDCEAALREAAVFFESVRCFKPTVQVLDVSAEITGAGVNLGEATAVISDYLNALAPAESYRESVLTALLLNLPGVADVVLTPNQNIDPSVSMLGVGWIRKGNVQVSLA